MLTPIQLNNLSEADRLQYESLVAANDTEAISQFEYFFGFTFGETEVRIPSNKEIELYKQMTDKIKLKQISSMLGFIPHIGQQPIFYTLDEKRDIINNIVMVLGRRAQPLDSLVKSPTGDILFKDIQIDDVIFDPDGGLQTIIGVHDTYQGDVYGVKIGNRTVRVDTSHLFTVIDSKGTEKVLDVEYIKDTYKQYNRYTYKVQNISPVEYPEAILPVLPYEFGKVTTTVPKEYVQSSIKQRLELLRGLMDTNGYSTKYNSNLACYQAPTGINTAFDMTSFVDLIHSLGGSIVSSTKTKCKFKINLNPFLNSKYSKYFKEGKPIYEYIKDIKYVGKELVKCISVSGHSQCYVTDNYIRTHNTGKSVSTSVIACRELAVPFSSTILLTPTFNNAKVIFNEVLKNIQKLKLPIKSINRGSFRFELENGARFSANSAANIESALGTYNSLLIVDEAQSVPNLMEIMNQMLVPTLLDYGVRPSGILYGKQVYLGTPRGTENQLYDLYIKQDEFPNWKSFNAPSTSNPILPAGYFEQMRQELGEMLYRQEILAEFFGSDDNVFWAFDKELNTYSDGDVIFNHHMEVVSGLDIGLKDSTAQLWAYRDPKGNYYIDEAYQQNMTSTATHIANYREIEAKLLNTPEMRYGDPAAAQTLFDYNNDWDYFVVSGVNDFLPSITYINQLLTPTGADNKPKLFINKKLQELIRQITRVRWKDKVQKSSKDPFLPDPKKTHWDLIAALRYMLYSDSFNVNSSMIVASSR